MEYKNAKTVLPEWLVEKLQEYVQGEIIYVPGKELYRVGWGEANGTREKYIKRNIEIMKLYKSGIGIEELAGMYYLSEYSIKKIINKMKDEICKFEKAGTLRKPGS